MSINTTEEALAFLHANRLMFEGKVGFKHYASQLNDLEEFVKKLAKENEELRNRETSG